MLQSMIQNFQQNPVECWGSVVMAIYALIFAIQSIVKKDEEINNMAVFYFIVIILVLMFAPAAKAPFGDVTSLHCILLIVYLTGLCCLPFGGDYKYA